MRTPLALSALLSLVLAAGSARAQDDATRARADEEFKRGREAFVGAHYKAALAAFKRSYELAPGRGKLLNIALCEEMLGLYADAIRDLREVLPQLNDDPERLSLAQMHIASTEKQVPHLAVAAGPDVAGQVSLDGRLLAAGSLGDVEINPGAHTIQWRGAGGVEHHLDLVIAPGEHKNVELNVVAVAEPDAARSNPRRLAGIVVGGVGVASLGLGAVTGAMALSKHAELTKLCPDPSRCSKQGVSLAQQGQALSGVSTAGFAVGVAAVGAGVYLIVTSHEPKSSAVGLALTAWPGGGGITASGCSW